MYNGHAEYDTIKAIKQAIQIPVVANGDVTTPQQAEQVLAYTGADAIMIGRGAQGNPWIFREIVHYLKTGEELAPPTGNEIIQVMREHLHELHKFYGARGPRIARKHIGWYLQGNLQDVDGSAEFKRYFNTLETPNEQLAALENYFVNLDERYRALLCLTKTEIVTQYPRL